MGGVLEVLNHGFRWEELVPNKEYKVQEGTELDYTAVACKIVILTQPEAEVETQLDQVGDVAGYGVGGQVSYGHNGLYNADWDGLLTLDRGSSTPYVLS